MFDMTYIFLSIQKNLFRLVVEKDGLLKALQLMY